MMVLPWVVDLHIHSALSPCADEAMTPGAIVAMALRRGLDVIGIADHNSAANVCAVMAAASGTGLVVLPCMEVQTVEEVHVLAVFDGVEGVMALHEHVYSHLPRRQNVERAFGRQTIFNKAGEPVGTEQQLLLVSTDLSLEQVCELVPGYGGLCIPAHVDRPAYGVIGVLGGIPAGLDVPALEMSPRYRGSGELRRAVGSMTTVCFSDAHLLQQVGSCSSTIWAEQPTVQSFLRAFTCQGGHRVEH